MASAPIRGASTTPSRRRGSAGAPRRSASAKRDCPWSYGWWRRRRHRTASAETVLVDLPVESLPVDAEAPRGFVLVSAAGAQRRGDRLSLRVGECLHDPRWGRERRERWRRGE